MPEKPVRDFTTSPGTTLLELLERFAGRVAEALLAAGPVDAVTVVVRKLRPPVPEDLDTSGVRIHRTR